MRFKPPPPNSDIGWRVEFRPMEVRDSSKSSPQFLFMMFSRPQHVRYCCYIYSRVMKTFLWRTGSVNRLWERRICCVHCSPYTSDPFLQVRLPHSIVEGLSFYDFPITKAITFYSFKPKCSIIVLGGRQHESCPEAKCSARRHVLLQEGYL